MEQIRAFVGHSFTSDDVNVVGAFASGVGPGSGGANSVLIRKPSVSGIR